MGTEAGEKKPKDWMSGQKFMQDVHVRVVDCDGPPSFWLPEVRAHQMDGFMWMSMVPDPRRSNEVILLSDYPLDWREAQRLWDNWDWQYEEDQGRM